MSKQSVRYTIHFLTAVSITAMVLFVIYGMQNGLFTDRTKMEMLIERGGIFGPLFFIFIQMVQVVVPIIWRDFLCSRCDLVWTMDGTSIQLYRDRDWIDD